MLGRGWLRDLGLGYFYNMHLQQHKDWADRSLKFHRRITAIISLCFASEILLDGVNAGSADRRTTSGFQYYSSGMPICITGIPIESKQEQQKRLEVRLGD